MKITRTVFIYLVVTLLIVSISPVFCFAKDRATKEECIARVADAAKLIQELGSETAFIKIMDKNGPFIWKDAHVFCFDTQTGVVLAHQNAHYIGSQMRFYTDARGGYPYADVLDLMKTRDKGWLTYVSDRMGSARPRLKYMHYRKVPGENIVICSGYYPSFNLEDKAQ